MLNDYLDRAMQYGNAIFYGVTLVGGTIMLIFSSWLWWHYTYLNPQNVFYAAINNNLIINGVTKHSVSQNNSGKLDQYDRINLGATNLVKSEATATQTGPDLQSKVITESIGTPDANFARYTVVETNQKSALNTPLNFTKVINQWSKEELGTGGEGSFANAIFDVVPFAHLAAKPRQEVMKSIKDNKVYDTDFSAVKKERKNGRLYYTYAVSVAPDKYINLLKQVDGLMGLNQLKNLDPSQYQGAQAIKLKLTVDARGHQLESATNNGNGQTSSYSGWGANSPVQLPENTVSKAELQAKLNTILSGQ